MDYDVAVIGGGPAGYVAAIKAARLGGRVVLFEKDTVGGTCLNRGCIPTKTYIKAAEYLHHIRNAKTFGITVDVSSAKVDMPRLVAFKDVVVKKLTGGVASLLKSNGVEVVHGEAKLENENTVSSGDKRWAAKNVILCGGSVAGKIPVPGIDHPKVLASDEILAAREIPRRLVIIGGGVIGCEIATAFNAFGSDVTVIEALPRLVAAMDGEISDSILKIFKKNGIKVLLNAKLVSVSDKNGSPVMSVDGGGDIEADAVLLSVGRSSDITCLGAMSGKIATERGRIIADDHMRTNVKGVFAAGDVVAAMPMLAHAAFKMGEAAASNAMGRDERANLKNVPGCLYTIPEASSVGLTEEEAGTKYDISVGKFPMAANGRTLASGERGGFIKVIIDRKYGEILGVHMVCESAAELISEAAALMEMEITVHEAADIIHPHPTFSEAFMEACADALGRCVHLPPKR
ncbi:MAG: dihydrolipoyl dehydrogenase [Synergistaceae bacterium]|jgi:dihydrolipoamide dehydrogenase|nr:dihydrolipoyl dehydrogenase [Synergistaceae bacterium]